MKAIVATALGMALFFCAQGARGASPASDQGSFYENPWGPGNAQSRAHSGFAPWVFDVFNTETNAFFIDEEIGAWGIDVPPDLDNMAGYDAAWISFKGDGVLDKAQTFSTTVLFTPPGPQGAVEAVDLFAQSRTVPSHYDNFGHQVLGIYLVTQESESSAFVLLVHTTLSDENPSVVRILKHFPFTGTASSPQEVTLTYRQLDRGHWTLELQSNGGNAVILTSHEFGTTWNRQGVDAVRFFTSHGGSSPGGPLEWINMSVD